MLLSSVCTAHMYFYFWPSATSGMLRNAIMRLLMGGCDLLISTLAAHKQTS